MPAILLLVVSPGHPSLSPSQSLCPDIPDRRSTLPGLAVSWLQQSPKRAFRHGATDQVALHLIASQQPQKLGLIFRFNTFRNDDQPQRMRQRDDRRNPSHGVMIVRHRTDERAVDLQRM